MTDFVYVASLLRT